MINLVWEVFTSSSVWEGSFTYFLRFKLELNILELKNESIVLVYFFTFLR